MGAAAVSQELMPARRRTLWPLDVDFRMEDTLGSKKELD